MNRFLMSIIFTLMAMTGLLFAETLPQACEKCGKCKKNVPTLNFAFNYDSTSGGSFTGQVIPPQGDKIETQVIDENNRTGLITIPCKTGSYQVTFIVAQSPTAPSGLGNCTITNTSTGATVTLQPPIEAYCEGTRILFNYNQDEGPAAQ